MLGPFKVEWNDGGLIIPRACTASSFIAFDVKTFKEPAEIKEAIQKTAEAIAFYNTGFDYNNSTKNCQHFTEHLLKELGIQYEPKGQLKEFLDKMRASGRYDCSYRVPEEYLAKFEKVDELKKIIRNGVATFTTHKELDLFVSKIYEEDPFYFGGPIGKDDYKLLKSFDRGFWLRHFYSFNRDKKSDPQYCPD
ncbi:hypothetical protein AKO1_000249, partial [Acrasis kona]